VGALLSKRAIAKSTATWFHKLEIQSRAELTSKASLAPRAG
jgi:hypothetical protein